SAPLGIDERAYYLGANGGNQFPARGRMSLSEGAGISPLLEVDVPVGGVDELLPCGAFGAAQVVAHDGEPVGLCGAARQVHADLAEEAVALAGVALLAGEDDIFPLGLPAAGAGCDVVDGQFLAAGFAAA